MGDNNEIGCSVTGFWFVMFLVLKLGGTGLATWSWWWIFLPIVPDLVFIFQKLGWL